MKKLITVFLSVFLIFSVCPTRFLLSVGAYETEGDYNYTVSDGAACITSTKATVSGDIVIPSTLGGFPVTEIGIRAFSSHNSLTSVVIPDSVVTIGEEAFYNCFELRRVTIGSSVRLVASQAFGFCLNLKRVNFTGSIADWCAIVFDDTYGTHPLTYARNTLYINDEPVIHLVIPDTVTTVNFCAFYEFEDVQSIFIPESVTSIGGYAFVNCIGVKHIWYEGGSEFKDKFDRFGEFGDGNGSILNAIWHFGTCKGGVHTYTDDSDCDCNACEWVRDVPAFADFTQGDIDLDGVCTASDLLRLRNHILNNYQLTKVEKTAADLNGDGEVNILDLIRFKKQLAEYSNL